MMSIQSQLPAKSEINIPHMLFRAEKLLAEHDQFALALAVSK